MNAAAHPVYSIRAFVETPARAPRFTRAQRRQAAAFAIGVIAGFVATVALYFIP